MISTPNLNSGWFTDNRKHKYHFYLPSLDSICGDLVLSSRPSKRARELGMGFQLGVPVEKCCKKCLKLTLICTWL